jgi:hypothetical protein
MLRCCLLFLTVIAFGLFASSGGAYACDPRSNMLTTGDDKYDAYDCLILEMAEKYGHPDPRILKSQVEWESRFEVFNTSEDSPCGIPKGWTDAESKSFGLLQVTPACGEGGPALLPNGHPNLTKDSASSLWVTSIFNPELNLDLGVKAIQGALNYFRKRFPNCDPIQFPLMAAAGYVQNWDTVVGCGKYTDRLQNHYINAVLEIYRQFGQSRGWPDPYPNSV